MALVTRCPNCAMTFRVTPLHLRVRNGKVKCGHCAYIFNGFITLAIVEEPTVPIPASHLPESPATETLVAENSPPLVTTAAETVIADPSLLLLSDAGQQITGGAEETTHPDQPDQSEAVADGNEIIFPVDFAALGPPEMAAAPLTDEPVPESAGISEERAPAMVSELESRLESSAGSEAGLAVTDAGENAEIPEDKTTSPTGPAETEISARPVNYAFEASSSPLPRQRVWGLASLLLFIVLAIQAVYTYRTALAVLVPQARPLLEGYCAFLLCDLPFPKDIESLNIESSELQADKTDSPASTTIITLVATIRNHASYTQALPAIELAFTNELDQPLAKRIFLPGQYLEKGINSDKGIAAGQEITVRLFIDNTWLNAVGYKLFLFYP